LWRVTSWADMARLAIVIAALTACSAQTVAAQQPTAQAPAGANAATPILRERVEQLRAKYLLDQVWFPRGRLFTF
jgi:hypothetical protein